MKIEIADSDLKIAACFDVIKVLRPHLADLSDADFVARIRRQIDQGYELVYIAEAGVAVSASGFRCQHMLYGGHVLYIDDLVTHPDHRGKGHGRALLDYIQTVAHAKGCDQIHLDSGHQRHAAHRLYLNFGFHINSHHFVKPLTPR